MKGAKLKPMNAEAKAKAIKDKCIKQVQDDSHFYVHYDLEPDIYNALREAEAEGYRRGVADCLELAGQYGPTEGEVVQQLRALARKAG